MKGNNNLTNTYEKYAIVDSKGKVIETFRQKLSAKDHMRKLMLDYFDEELRIVVVPMKNNTKTQHLNTN